MLFIKIPNLRKTLRVKDVDAFPALFKASHVYFPECLGSAPLISKVFPPQVLLIDSS